MLDVLGMLKLCECVMYCFQTFNGKLVFEMKSLFCFASYMNLI